MKSTISPPNVSKSTSTFTLFGLHSTTNSTTNLGQNLQSTFTPHLPPPSQAPVHLENRRKTPNTDICSDHQPVSVKAMFTINKVMCRIGGGGNYEDCKFKKGVWLYGQVKLGQVHMASIQPYAHCWLMRCLSLLLKKGLGIL